MSAVWASEPIPDVDLLYMRVHHKQIDNGNVLTGAFVDRNGMSTDWCKYSTPEQTRDRGRVPADNAVVSLPVGGVRSIPGLTVVHSPISDPPNRAHTDVHGVTGANKTEARLKLRRICKIVIARTPKSDSIT